MTGGMIHSVHQRHAIEWFDDFTDRCLHNARYMSDFNAWPVTQIEEELLRMGSERERQLRLLEYARLDFLSETERRIYLKNKIEASSIAAHPMCSTPPAIYCGLSCEAPSHLLTA